MAKVHNTDYTIRHGKLNKKDEVIYREQYGKERMYTVRNPFQGPATKAQKDHRSFFGKVNSVVNLIMADPAQQAEWKARMDEYNRSINVCVPPYPKRFTTTRQYVFSVISNRLKQLNAANHNSETEQPTLPRGIKLSVAAFSDLSAADIYEILKARYAVFTIEQGITYLDEDNIDYVSTHFSLRRNGQVIAYARLFPDADKEVLRVGRMLTLSHDANHRRSQTPRIRQVAPACSNACNPVLRTLWLSIDWQHLLRSRHPSPLHGKIVITTILNLKQYAFNVQ